MLEASLLGHVLWRLDRREVSKVGSGLPDPLKSNSLLLKVKHCAKPMVCPPESDLKKLRKLRIDYLVYIQRFQVYLGYLVSSDQFLILQSILVSAKKKTKS